MYYIKMNASEAEWRGTILIRQRQKDRNLPFAPYSGLVQLVERQALNLNVGGSIPSPRANLVCIAKDESRWMQSVLSRIVTQWTGYRSGERRRLLICYTTPWVRVPPSPPTCQISVTEARRSPKPKAQVRLLYLMPFTPETPWRLTSYGSKALLRSSNWPRKPDFQSGQ